MQKMKQQEVEVQITPMLDMAFQLLSFFILTYHPAPIEGQFAMNLLPAAPAVKMDAVAPPDTNAKSDLPPQLRTITTQLRANPDGSLGLVTLEELEVNGMDALKLKLQEILNPANKVDFEQALIQADPNLKYEELMKVIDIYSSLKINKISFGELNARTSL